MEVETKDKSEVLNIFCVDLKNLPEIPVIVKKLCLSHLNIDDLDLRQYTNLESFVCKLSEIKRIIGLPESLKKLICSSCNRLEQIEFEKSKLKELELYNCRSLKIDSFPKTLKRIKCFNCKSLDFSLYDLPSAIETVQIKEGCHKIEDAVIYNKKLKCYVDRDTNLVLESSDYKNKCAIGIIRNDKIRPLNKLDINFCKENEIRHWFNQQCVTDPKCIICFINLPSIMYETCCHIPCCELCYSKISNMICPLCHVKNDEVRRVYYYDENEREE